MNTRKTMRAKRKGAVRSKVLGTAKRPRLAVFRSNTRVYVQLIDDEKKQTIAAAWVKGKNKEAGKKLGSDIAQKAKAKHITSVVFDRGGFRYHGAVASVADAAREAGLTF